MKRRYVIVIILVTLVVTMLINIRLSNNYSSPTSVKQGNLNLSEWNHHKSKLIYLNGEWEFYWKKLLCQKDLKDNKPDIIVKIPSVWNSYHINGKKLSGFGYATFRIHVINAVPGENLALRMLPLSTSYKLYIDDQLLKQSGCVGKNRKTSSPGYTLDILNIKPSKSEFDIIIQVSNYTYARGGLWFEPEFGTAHRIQEVNREIILRECFFVGCFLVLMIFSIITFLFRIKDKSYLYLVIMSLSIISRIVFNGFSFVQIFQFVNLKTNTIIDYISISWFVAAFILWLFLQFGDERRVIHQKIVCICTILYNVFILTLPINVFTSYKLVIQLTYTIIIIISLIGLGIASIKGKKNALLLLMGFVIFFLVGANEMLVQDNFISAGATDYFYFACVFLLLLMYIMITKNFMETITERKLSIIKMNTIKQKEYEAELRFLKAQIKPHFIHNAINTIISISTYDSNRAINLLDEFSRYLRNCFDFENRENLVTIENEIDFINSYITIQKARFEERLQVQNEIQLKNVLIPSLILQPLVENAVAHGIRNKPEGGTIVIYGYRAGDQICIGVKDNGIGFTEDKINEVLSGIRNDRGVGLYNINQRLDKLYHTSLKIENIETGGVDISMVIPLIDNIVVNE